MRHVTAIALAAAALSLATSVAAQTAPGGGAEMFAKVDTNKDGALSLEEWKAAGRRDRGFAMIDANKDGKVTPDELRAAAEKYGMFR